MTWDRGPRSAGAVELYTGMRLLVGLTVVIPLASAGKRSEPPMSFPWCKGPKPAAAAAPPPPEEPPGLASTSQGLYVRPQRVHGGPRIENSGTFVRPMTIAPASRRFLPKEHLRTQLGLRRRELRWVLPGPQRQCFLDGYRHTMQWS